MIYLIGGPPKCGKTTLAKNLSSTLQIPWVSTDTLQNVIKPYVDKGDLANKFPVSGQKSKDNDEKYSKYSIPEIVDAYRTQARTVYSAIDMFVLCEITDSNDFIIEGYHIEPELAAEMNSKYPEKIKSIILIKSDPEKLVRDMQKSTTPNDWIITKTNQAVTYGKIAGMISAYGNYVSDESKKFDLKVMNMDNNFDDQIKEAIEYLTEQKNI